MTDFLFHRFGFYQSSETVIPENTHLLRKGKYHCAAGDLLFDWFGFDQSCKSLSNSTQTKQLNPYQSNRRSAAIQWYIPSQSKWVFSGSFIQFKQSSWILTSQTGGQLPYSDTSPHEVSECSLVLSLNLSKAAESKQNKQVVSCTMILPHKLPFSE